jgi:hypothetical protein
MEQTKQNLVGVTTTSEFVSNVYVTLRSSDRFLLSVAFSDSFPERKSIIAFYGNSTSSDLSCNLSLLNCLLSVFQLNIIVHALDEGDLRSQTSLLTLKVVLFQLFLETFRPPHRPRHFVAACQPDDV